MKAYIVAGMKRSGHHGPVMWISANIPYGTILFNDCSKGWSNKVLTPSNYQSPQAQEIAVGDIKNIRNAIFNIEDFNMDWLDKHDVINFHNVERYLEKYFILVLRDPWNWLASRLKMGGSVVKELDKKINYYNKQCEFALKLKTYKYAPSTIIINYNMWFTDIKYRKRLAQVLNLNTGAENNGLNILSTRGGGSSFDKLKYTDKAQDMSVLNRWKYYSKSEFFRDCIKKIPMKYQDLFPEVRDEYYAKTFNSI